MNERVAGMIEFYYFRRDEGAPAGRGEFRTGGHATSAGSGIHYSRRSATGGGQFRDDRRLFTWEQ